MSIYERIEELSAVEFDMENAKQAYCDTEIELVTAVAEVVKGAEVHSSTYGTGVVINVQGKTLEEAIAEIDFGHCTKRFSLAHLMTNTKLIQFVNEELYEMWAKAFQVHTNSTITYHEMARAARLVKIEAAKKAEADKKAEENYKKQKERASKDFDKFVQQSSTALSDVEEFYYALGWLTKHVGSVSAVLPDYLADAFTKHFGSDTPCRVLDSKKKSPAGWQAQWSWFFKVSLKKHESVPSILVQYLNPTGNALTDTAFVWDLIDNYGFQFGKKQDIEKIKQAIPKQFITSFETGLTE